MKCLIIFYALVLSAFVNAQSFCSINNHSGESIEVNKNEKGKVGNVDYELWYDSGNNSVTFYSDGSFSCSFENTRNYLCRSGIIFDNPKHHKKIGHIYADFKIVKKETENVDLSYIGAYGRNSRGNIRFFVIDNWLSQERPGDWVAIEKHGDFMIDGAMYTVYENPPYGVAMVGYESRDFLSVRKEARDCGTIDITAHLEQWEKLGMDVGEIREIKLSNEVGINNSTGCSGSIDFPYAKIYIYEYEKSTTTIAINSSTSTEKPKTTNDLSCSKAIVDQGYRCCSSNCTVIYSDEDGDWGAENYEWCGCGNGADSTTTTLTTNSATTTTTTETVSNPIVNNFCSTTGHSGKSVEVNKVESGKVGDVDYELWYVNGNNNYNKATFYSDGSFSCSFESDIEFLCRSGITYDNPKTPKEIGHVYADFKLVKNEIENIDYSYIGVYGFDKIDRYRAKEFYIVDNWLSQERPGDWVGQKKYGDFMIDGAMYTVYERNLYGPAIDGLETKQYFSIRKEARDCGTIDVTAHFEQWEKLGIRLDRINEIKIMVDGGSNNKDGCSGSVDFPYAKIYSDSVEDSTSTTIITSSTTTSTTTEKPETTSDLSCSKAILDQGYHCCSPNCSVIYSDEDGDWGVENNEWCGCGNGADRSTTLTTNSATTTTTTETVSNPIVNSFCSTTGHSGKSVEVNKIERGEVGDVDYELWYVNGNNNYNKATFYSDGSFSCSFESDIEFLCRSGITYDNPKTPKEIGHVYADFKLVKNEIENIDYSYIGVYGFDKIDKYRAKEFYIVDNWLSQERPGDWVGQKKYGDFMIDGAMYTVYERNLYGPAIDGLETKQYFSIRKEARDCGTIDVTAHFEQWEKLGMRLDRINEIKIMVDGGSNNKDGCSGSVDFPYSKIYTDNNH
eukprot:jgi/Orpsp1_1/1175428/evm.model.c7180000053800.1